MPFTEADREAMRKADAEIDAAPVKITLEDLKRDAEIDRENNKKHLLTEDMKAYKRAYYESRKDLYKARRHQQYITHRDYYKKRYAENRKERHDYYMAHREHAMEVHKDWYDRNRKEINERRRERRVKAKQIRPARLKMGLKQKEFALAVGVSPRQVVKWENGQAVPSKALFEKIQKFIENNT
ncbi:MAG: helix-turn-helix transcriptional regulator [Proteiniphilum sp.]|nr:helix-turn-helix transcriptional regulator [Proteiniphilum sp.]